MPQALRSRSRKKRAGKPVNRPVNPPRAAKPKACALVKLYSLAPSISPPGKASSLTVGSLAEQLGMSKSGLFAHFGSKEEFQLATVEMARRVFIDKVTLPAIAAPKGMPRLWSLIDHWLVLVEKRVFEGGCFFTAASFEFDGRLGR